MGAQALSSWFTGRWRRMRGHPAVLIRRVLAAALLVTAAVLAIRPAAAQAELTGPVVVSASDITAGSVLHPADVRVVPMPGSLRPAGALTTPEAVSGRMLVGSARAGEPITDVRLVGAPAGASTTADSHRSVVPVRLADSGIAALLHAGARVDVIAGDAAGQGGRQVLASMAMVVAVTAPEAEPRHGPSAAGSSSLVLLELPSDVATEVAAVSLGHPVAVTLR